ncbi:GTP pyrophosphokinase [Cohnella boryungensis]|uniref:GTP pyrophosphokinase family protein n=1 Tax=Cohnella boryungensis TaxID=768479 RepID=A0ABV8SIB8_9BACL
MSPFDVQCRVKDFESFYEKNDRKNYKKPFEEIDDICGLRVICYYPSDINRVVSIVKEEFKILDSEDKSETLEPDKFGYRSFHFVISLKEDWLKAPNFRELGELKAEIQIRTLLMHAWADISHKLSYKKKEHIPELFQRKLFQLSALFEIADDRFEVLKEEREEYINSLVNELKEGQTQSEPNPQLNLDSLQAFLDFHFPDRKRNVKDTTTLLDEIINLNISLNDLIKSYERTKDMLPQFEQEIFKEGSKRWAQVGIVRYLLDMTNKDYFEKRKNIIATGDRLRQREDHIRRVAEANSK